MKILITGSNGLLGQKIVKQCLSNQHEFLATSKGENRNPDCPNDQFQSLDITNESEVKAVFNAFLPDAVIHTAAMTNVDASELNPEECHTINVLGTKHLFEAAKKVKAHFQLVSTDFVFDGENGPYKESDVPAPLSIYGQSKLDAESLLTQSDYANWSITRTIIVYGTGHGLSRSNIVLWAREALKSGQELSIVNDQFRSPTWADDLAWGCLEVVRRKEKGIFHLSGPEVYSIIDLVKAIGAYYEVPTDAIKEVSSSTLSQPAKRPPRTGFILDKAQSKLGYHPKPLTEALKQLELELNKG